MPTLTKPVLVHPRNAQQLQQMIDKVLEGYSQTWVSYGPRKLASVSKRAEERLADLLGARKVVRRGAVVILPLPLYGQRNRPVLVAGLRRTGSGWVLWGLEVQKNEAAFDDWQLRLTPAQAAIIAENANTPGSGYKVSLDELPPVSPQTIAAVLLAASNQLKDRESRARYRQACDALGVSYADDILDAVGRLQCTDPLHRIDDPQEDPEVLINAAHTLHIERIKQKHKQEAVESGWAGVL